MRKFALLVLLSLLPAAAFAQAGGNGPKTPYAGQDARDIKSLSADDIAELRRGGGWGLAKAAELNGIPGPAHVLELKGELGLTPDQVAAISAVFAKMQAAAVAEGERLIGLEYTLEEQFRNRTMTDASLRQSLGEIEHSRQALRFIHLSTHLTTSPLLSPAQIKRYAELRGYGQEDPCATIPAGHDPAMWRMHNGCK